MTKERKSAPRQDAPPPAPPPPSSPDSYDPWTSEPYWQKRWEKAQIFAAGAHPDRPKYYLLEMFPYPSGRLHMGHARLYAMGDALARFKRAQGFDVLHPMGWDAFGLPAENAARQANLHPAQWTKRNIAAMKEQLKRLGFSFDWRAEIATCDPDYYRHQQEMFLDFLEKGFLYRKEADVNWDPAEKTVLANEQVLDGKGWRSGAAVEKRKLTQWFFAISDHAEALLSSLDSLKRWPEKVRLMQKNWIGRSEGVRFRFLFAEKAQSLPDGAPPPFGGLYDPRRHAFRRFLLRRRAGSSSKSRPRQEEPAPPRLPERMPRGLNAEARSGDDEEKRFFDGSFRPASLSVRGAASGLCGEFHPDGLWNRRDFRLPRP